MTTPKQIVERIANAKGWDSVPMWTLARRVDRVGFPEADLLSVYREWGVIRKSDRDDNFNKPSDDLSGYKLVESGDLVLNKMKTWQGSLGVSPHRGIVSPAYFVCQVSPRIHGRYLHHVLRSPLYTSFYAAASKGIRPNQWDLPYDEFRNLPVAVPPLEEQRRIADFLDDQVARIDNIIAVRRTQVGLLNLRLQSAIDGHFVAESNEVRLGRFITSIEQGWSPQCDGLPAGADEWGVLKVSAVRSGHFEEQENKRLPDDLTPDVSYEVRSGDLLITRANTPKLVGQFAVVPEGARTRLIMSDKIMRVRLTEQISASYVQWFGQSSGVRSLMSMAGTGTSQSMVNVRGSDVRDLKIPSRTSAEQEAVVTELHSLWIEHRKAQVKIQHSVSLLNEMKRSLITAAVTGEFDVSAADGSRVPV